MSNSPPRPDPQLGAFLSDDTMQRCRDTIGLEILIRALRKGGKGLVATRYREPLVANFDNDHATEIARVRESLRDLHTKSRSSVTGRREFMDPSTFRIRRGAAQGMLTMLHNLEASFSGLFDERRTYGEHAREYEQRLKYASPEYRATLPTSVLHSHVQLALRWVFTAAGCGLLTLGMFTLAPWFAGLCLAGAGALAYTLKRAHLNTAHIVDAYRYSRNIPGIQRDLQETETYVHWLDQQIVSHGPTLNGGLAAVFDTYENNLGWSIVEEGALTKRGHFRLLRNGYSFVPALDGLSLEDLEGAIRKLHHTPEVTALRAEVQSAFIQNKLWLEAVVSDSTFPDQKASLEGAAFADAVWELGERVTLHGPTALVEMLKRECTLPSYGRISLGAEAYDLVGRTHVGPSWVNTAGSGRTSNPGFAQSP